MARLEYQNTAVPDFSNSIQGFSQMGRLLSGAADATSSLFAGLQQRQTDAADRIVAERALAMQDPTVLQRALADGSLLGDQAGKVSTTQLGKLASAVSDRTTTSTGVDALNLSRDNLQRRNNAQGALTNVLSAVADGDANQAALRWQNDDIRQLRPEDQLEFLKGTSPLLTADLSRRNTQSILDSRESLEADQQTAAGILNDITRNSYDGGSALGRYGHTKFDNPRVEALVRGSLEQRYPGDFIPGTGGGGMGGGALSGGGGRGAPTDRNDLHARQLQQESEGDPNAVSSAGARGLMQLMPKTAREWEAKLGLPSGSTDMDPVANERVGRAYMDSLLERYNGNQVQALAAYNWGMGNVDKWIKNGSKLSDLPKETQGYLRNILRTDQSIANPLQTADAVQDVQRANTQANAGNLNDTLARLEGNPAERPEIITGLAEGLLKGYSAGEISEELRKIEAGGFNPSQAGAILADSVTGRSGIVDAFRSGFNPLNWFKATSVRDSTPGTTFDRGLIEDTMRRGKGQMLQDASANRDRSAVAGQIAQADEKIANLRSRAGDIRRRAGQMGSKQLSQDADRVEQQLANAIMQRDQLHRVQQNNQPYTTSDLSPRQVQEPETRLPINIEDLSGADIDAYQRGNLPDWYWRMRTSR